MTTSPESSTFTDTILSTVRLQRHLGTRILVSTQEPTVSEALLDLSSIIIVHRFTSPQWMNSLRCHLAPLASESIEDAGLSTETADVGELSPPYIGTKGGVKGVFREIVSLKVGEALLFSPTAMVACKKNSYKRNEIRRLGSDYIKVRIRARITADGGRSVLAN